MHNLNKKYYLDKNLDRKSLAYLDKYLNEHPDISSDKINEYIKKIEKGIPIQYIVGDVNFYGNIIKVNENVLIPRYCTEELVEKTLSYIDKFFQTNKLNILDLCTGSGCIAISLKKELPSSNIVASDISVNSLKLAKENATINLTDITFLESDLFKKILGKYHVIISNPPYLDEYEEIESQVRKYEPSIALFAPNNGLYYYEEILKNVSLYLEDKYLIAFEIGYNQKDALIKLKDKYLKGATIISQKDLEGFERFIFITNIV